MDEIESWQNGKWVPNSQLGIPITDAHVMYGISVFDALRTYKHNIWRMDSHLDRLHAGMRMAGIKNDDTRLLRQILFDCIHHNSEFFPHDEEYRFMIYVSPGDFPIYMDNPESRLTVFVTPCSQYAQYVAPYLEKGVVGSVVSQQQIPFRFIDPRVKQCSRWHYWMADREVDSRGMEPIMLDEQGFVAESSGSNIGVVDKDGVLWEPYGVNHLGGIMMDSLGVAYPCELTPYDLIHADSVIFTSTFKTVVPCYNVTWMGRTYELPNKYDMPRKLLCDFGDRVGVDLVKQWEDWFYSR